MPRRTSVGRHARPAAAAAPAGAGRLPVRRTIAACLVALAGAALLVGMTIRPAFDAGGAPSETPNTRLTGSTSAWGTWHKSSAHTKATSATTSPRADRGRPRTPAGGEDTPESSTSGKQRQERQTGHDRREPTRQTSTRARRTRPSSSTTSPPAEPTTTPSTKASPSPSQSTESCESPFPDTDPRRKLTCRISSLLP